MTAPTLTTKLDREAPDAKARFEHNKALATDLRSSVVLLSGVRRDRPISLSSLRVRLYPVPRSNRLFLRRGELQRAFHLSYRFRVRFA